MTPSHFFGKGFLGSFKSPDITYVFDTIATIPHYVVQKLFKFEAEKLLK